MSINFTFIICLSIWHKRLEIETKQSVKKQEDIAFKRNKPASVAIRRVDSVYKLFASVILLEMELISLEIRPSEIHSQQLLLARVKRSLELISTHVHFVNSQNNTCCFLVLLKQKKKQEHKLWTQWQVSVNRFFQIQVSLSDQQQQFLQRDPSININEFLTRLNRESILGTYFNSTENSSLINFRHTFPVQMNKKFISGTISEIFMDVSEQFWKWVVKLRLLGGEQKVKSIKIFSCLKKIRYLKQYFQHQRLNRPRALKTYNLKNSNIKIVEQAIRAVGYQPNLLNNYKANQLDRNQYLIYKMEYESVLKELANRTNKQEHSPIMQGIQIRQTINQKKFDEGGYSEIFRGEYIAGVIPTIFNYGIVQPPSNLAHISQISEQSSQNKMPDSESFSQQNFSRRLLVKKVMKSCIKEVDTFKNEINLLIFIRNDREERIAGYYMQTHNEHQNLFMELYEHNLNIASNSWNEKQLLNATKEIIQGIAYLHRRNIIHRDIKELNILIDRHNHVKLIDFGSACAIYHETPLPGSYVAINNDLHSTPNYYFPYNAIANEYPGIKKKYTREQYNQAATFDIFSVGTVMYNLFRLQQGFDNIFYRELTYLADKCHQKNPEDRLTPKQAESFIHLLMELHRLENEQDKKASVKSWSQSEDGLVLPKQLFKQE